MAYYECSGTADDTLLLKISVKIWSNSSYVSAITPYEYIIYKNKTWYYDAEIGRTPFNGHYNGVFGWVSNVEFLSNTQIKLILGLQCTTYSAKAVSISYIINIDQLNKTASIVNNTDYVTGAIINTSECYLQLLSVENI